MTILLSKPDYPRCLLHCCVLCACAYVLSSLAYGLADMDISNNPGVTGFLPPQMGVLTRVKQVRATNTNMSCAGIVQPYNISTNNSCSDPERCRTPRTFGNADSRYQVCKKDELLPCFLRFSDYLVPRDDESNMRCKLIQRRPVEEAKANCGGPNGNVSLGEQAAQLPEYTVSDRQQQMWYVDPGYYQFQVCECLLVSLLPLPERETGQHMKTLLCST